jgi:hypothetical protein
MSFCLTPVSAYKICHICLSVSGLFHLKC